MLAIITPFFCVFTRRLFQRETYIVRGNFKNRILLHPKHSICVVYSEKDYFSLYKTVITDRLSKGHGVIYVAQENERVVTRGMSEANINTDKHFRNGSLRILSTSSFYSPEKTKLSSESLRDICQTAVQTMMNDSGVSNVLIVGSCRAFIDTSRHDELVLYENAVKEHIISALPADFICCYAEPRLHQISPIKLASILYHHTNILSRRNKELNKNNNIPDVDEMIRSTFDEVLGNNCSDLIFKTMKLVYKLDQSRLFLDPGIFEEKLSSMLGNKTTDVVFYVLKKRLINYLLQCGDHSNVAHMAKEE